MNKYTFEYRNGNEPKTRFFLCFAPSMMEATEMLNEFAPLADIVDGTVEPE